MKRPNFRTCLLFILISFFVAGSSIAQENQQNSATAPGAPLFRQNTPPGAGDSLIQIKHLLSDFEFWLSAMILLFGALMVIIEYLIIRQMQQVRPEDALKLFAITFIIVGTLVFVAAGFDSTQIAPAAGLFGTIAGYLLGRDSRNQGSQHTQQPPESSDKKEPQ